MKKFTIFLVAVYMVSLHGMNSDDNKKTGGGQTVSRLVEKKEELIILPHGAGLHRFLNSPQFVRNNKVEEKKKNIRWQDL